MANLAKVVLASSAALILLASQAEVLRAKNKPTVYPTAPAPRLDVTQAQKRLTQDLTSQQAAALIRERKLANAAQQTLLDELDRKDKALRLAANTNAVARAQLDAVIAERDRLTREIVRRDSEAQQQIAAYEVAIKKVALSDDPKIVAYLERFAAGDNVAIDEFVTYARAQFEIRQRLNNIQFAEQLRVAAAQKNVMRQHGELTLKDVIPLFEEAYSLDPADAWGGIELGRLYLASGQESKALAVYRDLLPRILEPRFRSILLNEMGDALVTTDPAEALKLYREGLEIFRKLAAQDANDLRAQRDLVVSLNNIGDALTTTDPAEALKLYRESLAIVRKLVAKDANDLWAQRNLCMSLSNVGDILRTTDPTEALNLYRESLDVARRLAARDAKDGRAQRNVSVGLYRVGNALTATDPAGALRLYRESLDIDRKVAARDPSDLQAQRDVSIALERFGDALANADPAEALKCYRESLDIARKLAARNANDLQGQRDVSVSLMKIGDALVISNPIEALNAYRESLEIFRKLAARDAADLQALRDESVSLMKIGNMLRHIDPGEALKSYRESLDIFRKLSARNPADLQALRDVSVNCNKIGDALVATNPAEALKYYREGLDIARKLAARDANDLLPQKDLWASLFHVATVTNQKTDWLATKAQGDTVKTLGQFSPNDEGMYQFIVERIKYLEAAGR